jgi:predicted choloylglycine hydrolase
MKNNLLTVLLLLLTVPAFSCTLVIVSGKATRDGRPLMWKNSDTENLNHRLIYSPGNGGYPLIGIARNASTNDTTAVIWVGTNSAGFCIMNSISYNISAKPAFSNNGTVMRRALDVCRNVSDFKHFLDTLARPMKVGTNYGVIDAEGNAAFFETNSDGYCMLDVNDPVVAPNGYLVYTNFSYSGFYDGGHGYIRYQSANYQMAKGLPNRQFSPQWILNRIARSFYHSLMDIDFTSPEATALFKNGYIHDSDFIPRRSTASSTVIQGVKKGENPELTTLWTVLGYPPCSVALPAWVKAGKDNPSLLMQSNSPTDTTHTSKMCNMALALKADVFDVKRGHGGEYLNFSKVYNAEGTGYMQRIAPIENRVFEQVTPLLEKWRRAGAADIKEMKEAARTVDSYVDKSWNFNN